MRIGIGCTTYNRPECLVKWKKQIAKHTKMDNVLIYIADDSIERKGVAYRKNECLRALKDCDYVFLFDDDCYPIKDGWADYFIDFAGDNHLLFMSPKFHAKLDVLNILSYTNKGASFSPTGNVLYSEIDIFADCGGVFMFLTHEHIKTVGAFNEEFGLWGFEHAEYSQRIYDKPNYYLQLKGTDKFIFAEDYNNPTFKSSVTNEEKNFLFKKNISKFAKGYEKRYIPL